MQFSFFSTFCAFNGSLRWIQWSEFQLFTYICIKHVIWNLNNDLESQSHLSSPFSMEGSNFLKSAPVKPTTLSAAKNLEILIRNSWCQQKDHIDGENYWYSRSKKNIYISIYLYIYIYISQFSPEILDKRILHTDPTHTRKPHWEPGPIANQNWKPQHPPKNMVCSKMQRETFQEKMWKKLKTTTVQNRQFLGHFRPNQ